MPRGIYHRKRGRPDTDTPKEPKERGRIRPPKVDPLESISLKSERVGRLKELLDVFTAYQKLSSDGFRSWLYQRVNANSA